MADGNPAPIEANALSKSNVLGSNAYRAIPFSYSTKTYQLISSSNQPP